MTKHQRMHPVTYKLLISLTSCLENRLSIRQIFKGIPELTTEQKNTDRLKQERKIYFRLKKNGQPEQSRISLALLNLPIVTISRHSLTSKLLAK